MDALLSAYAKGHLNSLGRLPRRFLEVRTCQRRRRVRFPSRRRDADMSRTPRLATLANSEKAWARQLTLDHGQCGTAVDAIGIAQGLPHVLMEIGGPLDDLHRLSRSF